jgi:hypothetical protein
LHAAIVKEGIIQPARINKLIRRRWSLKNTASGAGVIPYIKRQNRRRHKVLSGLRGLALTKGGGLIEPPNRFKFH